MAYTNIIDFITNKFAEELEAYEEGHSEIAERCSFILDAIAAEAKVEFATKKASTGLTENGMKILDFMNENRDKFSNLFRAKDIAEGLFISSRSVSGAIRKLVTDGYVTKKEGNPITYSIV